MRGFSNRPRNRASSTRSKLNYYRRPEPSAKSPFKAVDAKKPKHPRWLVRGLDILVVAVVFFCFIYSLIVQPKARLDVNNLTYRPAAVYKNAANASLGAFKNRNKITLDSSSIVLDLKKQFPEISTASVELPLFGEQPILHVNVALPNFWLTSKAQTFLIDSDGVAVGRQSDFPGIKNLPLVEDQTGFSLKGGMQALSSSQAQFINQILLECRTNKVPIASITLPTRASELDLRTTDRPYYVKFYLGGDARIQSGQFLAARHNFDVTKSQPAEYLDVRVTGKVFYK